MTKRDKVVMFSSMLLALCVIVSSFIFIATSSENNENVNIESLIYVSIIMIIAICSVWVVYINKVRKGKHEKMLNVEYFEAYEIVKDVIMNAQLSDVSKKETIEDILDILLESQNSGKSVDLVIGNPVAFSKKIIHEYTNFKRYFILSLFDGMIAFSLFIIGVTALMWLEQVDKSFFNIGVDINMVLFFLTISFLVLPVTKKLTSTKNPWTFLIPLGAGITYILVTMILRKNFYTVALVRTMLDDTIIMIPNMAIFMIYLLMIPVLMKLKKLIRKRPIRE